MYGFCYEPHLRGPWVGQKHAKVRRIYESLLLPFHNTREIPDEVRKTLPQVFPTTARENFTWLPDIGPLCRMTTFYPHINGIWTIAIPCFSEMMYNFSSLANQGNGPSYRCGSVYLEEELGTPLLVTWNRFTHRPYDAYDRRDCLPKVVHFYEGRYGAEKVVPYFGF